MQPDYNIYVSLARRLQDKWRAEGKLPKKFSLPTPGHNSICSWKFNSISYMNMNRRGKGYGFGYTDNSGYDYNVGPELTLKEVLRELWPELDEAEKAQVMSTVLGGGAK